MQGRDGWIRIQGYDGFRSVNILFVAAKLPFQVGLGALQPVTLRFRQRLAGAVDIKHQH